MKILPSLTLLFALLITSPAFAAAEKLCTGTSGEFKNYEIKISATKEKLVVSSMPSNGGYIAFPGTYASNKLNRRSRDGSPQLGFDGYEEGGFNEFFLDAKLLEADGKGFLDVTHRNEGSLTVRFACENLK